MTVGVGQPDHITHSLFICISVWHSLMCWCRHKSFSSTKVILDLGHVCMCVCNDPCLKKPLITSIYVLLRCLRVSIVTLAQPIRGWTRMWKMMCHFAFTTWLFSPDTSGRITRYIHTHNTHLHVVPTVSSQTTAISWLTLNYSAESSVLIVINPSNRSLFLFYRCKKVKTIIISFFSTNQLCHIL